MNKKDIHLLDDIKKLQWFKSWEAKFPMFLVTIGAPGYFKSMKDIFGFELKHFLVITREGILSGYWVEDELTSFGAHLTKLAEQNPVTLKKWSECLKEETDRCRALMRRGRDYFFNIEHFKELRKFDEVLSAYQVAVREVINYLPDALREEYTPDLEGARKYSETIFFELGSTVTSTLEYVAKQENIPSKLIGCITGDELEIYFETKKLPGISTLEKRYGCSGFINHPEFSWLAEEDIKEIEKSFVENSTGEIRGQPAYKGKIVGRARVIKNFSAAGDFPRGEILVTGMTDPNYVPIMEKAAAIVTDAGGMLCHAAIVSREMKKPCIVGTKIATHLIKTGDMVEVDADKGIVRIVGGK
jgi:phosphohistidine swiveling domain-containing protein